MSNNESWTGNFGTYRTVSARLVDRAAAENAGPVTVYQCQVCALERITTWEAKRRARQQDIADAAGGRRARDDDDGAVEEFVEPCPHPFNWYGTGCWKGNKPNSKFLPHLSEKHAIVSCSCQKAIDFFDSAKLHAHRYGWDDFATRPMDAALERAAAAANLAENCTDPELVAVLAWAEAYRSFNSADGAATQLLLKKSGVAGMNRKKMRELTLQWAGRLTNRFLKKHENKIGHITIDVGTVWTRYVAVVLHVQGAKPILLELLSDAEFVRRDDAAVDDEAEGELVAERVTLTGEQCADHLRALIDRLTKKHKILVLSVTTDNGSNMTLMSKLQQCFSLRCACHVLQLMVRALLRAVPPLRVPVNEVSFCRAFKLCTEFKARCTPEATKEPIRFPKTCETRWNSEEKLVQFCATFNQRDKLGAVGGFSLTDEAHIKDLAKRLAKWRIATKMCEADDADVFTVLEALAAADVPALVALPTRDRPALSDGDRQAILDHLTKLVGPSLLIVAYFCSPGYRQTDIGIGFTTITATIRRWFDVQPVFSQLCTHLGLHGYLPFAFFGTHQSAFPPPHFPDLPPHFFYRHHRILPPHFQMRWVGLGNAVGGTLGEKEMRW